MRYSPILLFSYLLLSISGVSYAYADTFTLTITSNHRFAKGDDTPSICPGSGNSNISCDILDKGPNCGRDDDEYFFDSQSADPNQQSENLFFFNHCNIYSTNYDSQGVGPQFVIYLQSENGGSSSQLTSCILLSNASSSQPTRSTLNLYEDLNPSGSTPTVASCPANHYALYNLQQVSVGSDGNFSAQVACVDYLTGQHQDKTVTLNTAMFKNHYVPCPVASSKQGGR